MPDIQDQPVGGARIRSRSCRPKASSSRAPRSAPVSSRGSAGTCSIPISSPGIRRSRQAQVSGIDPGDAIHHRAAAAALAARTARPEQMAAITSACADMGRAEVLDCQDRRRHPVPHGDPDRRRKRIPAAVRLSDRIEPGRPVRLRHPANHPAQGAAEAARKYRGRHSQTKSRGRARSDATARKY